MPTTGNDRSPEELRITQALGRMPYLPLADWYSTSHRPEDLARTLEELVLVLERLAQSSNEEHAELIELRSQRSALRRLLGTEA